eukprot:6204116-Pleurochrysis_carterae.AAC.1
MNGLDLCQGRKELPLRNSVGLMLGIATVVPDSDISNCTHKPHVDLQTAILQTGACSRRALALGTPHPWAALCALRAFPIERPPPSARTSETILAIIVRRER